MLRRCFRWLRAHPRKLVFLLLVLGVFLLNGIAYMHARAMTHFTQDGNKPAAPESLSPLEKAAVLCTGVRLPKPTSDATPADFGLSSQTHALQVDGFDLEAWFLPHPRSRGVVLLFHGYGGCKAHLLTQARQIHDLGYSAFLIDFRGSGGSSGWETTIGFDEARDVVGAVDYVRAHWPGQPLVLYGQSMGAAAVLRAIAHDGVQADALILESTFDCLLSTVENRFTAMRLPRFPLAHLLVFWGGVQLGFNAFEHNPMDYARAVRCPALLLHGQEDSRVTQEQARAIFDNISTDKQFQLFPGARHESLVAVSPELWKRTVGGFLSTWRSTGSP